MKHDNNIQYSILFCLHVLNALQPLLVAAEHLKHANKTLLHTEKLHLMQYRIRNDMNR